ncbi:MAG: cell envelope integrity protein TolA [Roseateles sp.]|nr:MAG: cell envelope integrity protein TolA [Roseateles sp.]
MAAASLRPPESAGIGRGVVLALLAHGLLVLGLTYGLNWRSTATPAFEAELWASVPTVAAPAEQAPPEPEPEAPKPDTAAQQRAAAQAEAEAQAEREAEIAIARERKRKDEQKARELELRQQQEAKEKAAKAGQAAKDKAAKDKALKDKADKEKADKAKDEQERKKADAKAAKEAKEADARREAMRQEQLRRIQGLAGATGAPGSTGTAQQNAAPSAGYAGRIKARIRPMIIFNADSGANPEVEVRITLAPDGRILGIKVLKASPDPDWDRAVQRGIEKAEAVPRDVDGRVPSYIDLILRPRE